VRHHLDHTAAGRVVLPSLHHPQESSGDTAFLLNTLGRLWLAGVSVDWPEYYAREQRCRLPLPTYPFERQRYWVDPPRQIHQAPTGQVAIPQAAEREPSGAAALDTSTHEEPAFTLYQRPHLATAYVAPSNEIEQSIAAIWQELLGIEQVGIYDDFFELGGHSLMATQLISRLREAFPVELPLKALFEAPTIARFAEVIEELLIQQLEALPEEDAERLI
jgi:acyl transferase domain-containing protein